MKNQKKSNTHKNIFASIPFDKICKSTLQYGPPIGFYKSTKTSTDKSENSKNLLRVVHIERERETKKRTKESIVPKISELNNDTTLTLMTKNKEKRSFSSVMKSSINTSMNKKETAISESKLSNEKVYFEESKVGFKSKENKSIIDLKKKLLHHHSPIFIRENTETNEKFSKKLFDVQNSVNTLRERMKEHCDNMIANRNISKQIFQQKLFKCFYTKTEIFLKDSFLPSNTYYNSNEERMLYLQFCMNKFIEFNIKKRENQRRHIFERKILIRESLITKIKTNFNKNINQNSPHKAHNKSYFTLKDEDIFKEINPVDHDPYLKSCETTFVEELKFLKSRLMDNSTITLMNKESITKAECDDLYLINPHLKSATKQIDKISKKFINDKTNLFIPLLQKFTNLSFTVRDNLVNYKLLQKVKPTTKILFLIDSTNLSILLGIYLLKNNFLEKIHANIEKINCNYPFKIPKNINFKSVKKLFIFSNEEYELHAINFEKDKKNTHELFRLFINIDAFSL